MSNKVDVLAVLDAYVTHWSKEVVRTSRNTEINDAARSELAISTQTRAAVAELIEADAEYDKCRADLRDLRVHLGHKNPLHHETPHLLRYEASVKRRSAALARVKGE